MDWHQGEHVLLIGQTGSGKTALAKEILPIRSFCLALVAKQDDLNWSSWQSIRAADDIRIERDADYAYLRLVPPIDRMADEFASALRRVWHSGGWTIYVDELYYLQDLGCERLIRQLLTQGRSKFISVVCGCQRPANVSRYALSETTHILSGVIGDKRDLDTLRKYVGGDFAERVQDLQWYQFLWYNKRRREMSIVTRDTVNRIGG